MCRWGTSLCTGMRYRATVTRTETAIEDKNDPACGTVQADLGACVPPATQYRMPGPYASSPVRHAAHQSATTERSPMRVANKS